VIINKKLGRGNSERNSPCRVARSGLRCSSHRGICFTLPNRDLSTICKPSIPSEKTPQNFLKPANIYKWSRPLLTGTASQTQFVVTSRKRSLKKFLTGARTPLSGPATQLSKLGGNPPLVPDHTFSKEPIPSSANARLNRQIHELELNVTHRKQKTAPSSNRQKIKKCLHAFSALFLTVQTRTRSLDAPTENKF